MPWYYEFVFMTGLCSPEESSAFSWCAADMIYPRFQYELSRSSWYYWLVVTVYYERLTLKKDGPLKKFIQIVFKFYVN